MILVWVLAGIAVFVAGISLFYFNRFAVLGNRIENSLSQIDVQLKRRADLIPNLMESVKGYMGHEKSIMKSVTDARKALLSAKGLVDRIKADNNLEGFLGRLFALAENYPNLKADTNFLELQRELSATEDKIAYARQYYNDSILTYNDLCRTFPGAFFANLYGKKPKEYLKIADSERKNIKVKFD